MRGDWWTRTWNPWVCCSKTAMQGCVNCWAERWAWRLAQQQINLRPRERAGKE